MKCESVREKLTAYLDGDLEGDRASAIRGHLRSCDACRAMSNDEAALRDGLRSLPPLYPPASLWAGVQARLAAEEVKDAERSGWARAFAWLKVRARQLAIGGVAVAAAITLIALKLQRDGEPSVANVEPTKLPVPEIKSDHNDQVAQPEPPRTGTCDPTPADDGDVTAVLAAEPTKVTECYAQTAHELLELAKQARGTWPADRQRDFDIEVASLQKSVAAAGEEPLRQRAYRKLIRFVQRAVLRDDVALANLEGVQ
jgi:negative regulator of sigma E activity